MKIWGLLELYFIMKFVTTVITVGDGDAAQTTQMSQINQ